MAVYFSASDGSDPRSNGRCYELVVPDPAVAHGMVESYSALLIEDDVRLLELMFASSRVNNTFMNNFVLQCDGALEWLRKHGGAHGCAVVLGCGHKPWAPLRLLAEGFDEVIANDLFPVLDAFSTAAIDDVIGILQPLRPDLANRLESKRTDRRGQTQIRGLTTRGECAFEDMALDPESIDFIYSNSVLEHVTEPRAVYEAIARYLRPGGVGYHSIDLRDHLHYFDPLRFLTMSEAEYAEINTENRLRASDHIRLAKSAGLDVEVLWFRALTQDGGIRSDDSEPPVRAVKSWADIAPVLDEEALAAIDPAFASHDPKDLAVVGLDAVIRKR